MIVKKIKHYFMAVMTATLILSVLSIHVMAAETAGLICDNTTVSDTNKTADMSVSVSTSFGSGDKSTTYTFTNNTGSEASFSFILTTKSNTGDGEGTFSCSTNVTHDKITGACSVKLAAGGTFTITLRVTCGWFGGQSLSVQMSDISYKVTADSSVVTVLYDSNIGTVKNGSNVIANGGTVTTTKDTAVTLNASTIANVANAQFIAWIDPTDNKVLSKSASYLVESAGDTTIKAVFATTAPWFFVNGGLYLVEGFDAAVSTSGTIVLANNATLTARDTPYTIPSGVNMLVPFSATDTGTFGAIPEDTTLVSASTPTTFRTLTVADGATLVVNGKLNVNGQRNVDKQGSTGTGTAKGGHGLIKLQGDETQLTVNSTGALYCYGFISGTGGVTLNGGDLHELMQVYDWGGGSNLSGWYFALGNKKAQTLFFTSHYYVQNVEAPLTVYSGSDMFIEAALTISGTLIRSSEKIVSDSNSAEGLFLLGSGTNLVRTYDASTDRVEYALGGSGSVGLSSIKVDVKVGFSVSLDSAEYTLPLNNAMIARVGSGVTMNMTNRAAIMPGAQIIVDDGGILNLTNHLYIFDKDDKTGLFFANQLAPKYTAGRGTTVKITSLDSGRLEVNGDLNISGSGGLYTTIGGSNTDKIVYGTGTIKHEGTLGAGALRGGYTSDYVTVSVSNGLANLAKLDGMNAFEKNTYHGLGPDHNNYWYINSATVDATCTEDAVTKYYCTDATKYYAVVKEGTATGHSYTASVTAPTCSEAGYTTHTCSACGDSYKDSEVAAAGHTVSAWTVTDRSSQDIIEKGTCSVCGQMEERTVSAVAATNVSVGNETKYYYYATLQEAVSAANGALITMYASTTEPGFENSTATVILDLNGKTVTLTGTKTMKVAALYGMDTSTNGYDATLDTAGKIVGTVEGVQAPKKIDRVADVSRIYVPLSVEGSDDSKPDSTYFFRAAVSLTGIQFIRDSKGTYMIFRGMFKANEPLTLSQVGFQFDVNDNEAVKSVSDSSGFEFYYGRSSEGITSAAATAVVNGNTISGDSRTKIKDANGNEITLQQVFEKILPAATN